MAVLRVTALVPARNEADRIAATVRGLRELPGVGEVVVVDDGSSDGTPAAAAAAGARVLVAPRGMGKGAALEGALRRLPPADVYVLVDGDVGESASAMAPLLEDVVGGRADLAIAVPPPPPRGGFGLVKGSARLVVQALTGFAPRAPLSGQRVVTARAMAACRPLARGFGVETAMTLDVLRSGYRVVEVPAAIGHRFTGRDVRGFAHRARQGLDAARAAIPRLLRLR
jgi:glycosyltransferase involved in cell wall biosynthesis